MLLALPGFAAEVPNEKADKYHSALLRRPSGGYLFDRFFNAWLDSGTIDGLGEYLDGRDDAAEATTADRLLHGYFLVKTGREAEALAVFEKALEDDPENAEAWAEAAKARARVLDFERAVTDLDKAIAMSDDDDLSIEFGKLKGRWLARIGKTDEALVVWKSLTEQFPDDDELREDLVDLQLAESLVDEALATQEALVESTRDPYHKITRRLRLGDIYLRSGEQEEAKRIYGESLEASGQDTWLEKEILAQIEQLFRREDDIAGLDEYYTSLVEKNPGRIGVRLRLADVLAERGESGKAVETFRDILKMTPGDRDNREAFVDLLGRVEKLDEAVVQMKALAESFPDDPELPARLAAWQHEAGAKVEAKESVGRFLELSDGSEYSHLRAARMLEQFEQPEAAAEMFGILVAKFPDSTGAIDEQAAFLHRTGKTEEAIELWKGIAATGDSQDAIRAARMLSARGERESAYNILLERADEFATDFVFLGRLCNEALASNHAVEAIPWMERRLALAENPGDLAEVLRQAISILSSAEKSEEYRDELRERIGELSVAEACLLSEMLDRNGEYDAATLVLEPLMEQGEILALDQRVRQLVSRDDWQTAAEEMERIVELPDERRSNNIERLVELHRRALNYEAALAWLEEWKKVSPGASRPWLFQAQTLNEKGDSEAAIEVLRQAAGRFEDEEEARTLLASYFSQQGKNADAERIYWNLYEESEDVGSKLRWVGSLAQTAEAQGQVDELVEQFQERRRDNRTSIAPLLAIAEIHRRTNNYEGRREALLEATRMRPEDLSLLQQIARIEESEGDWERAVETLETALALDKTDDTERRIALLHLRYGASEEAYRRFYELAGGEKMDADTVIGLADAMIARSDWERALQFLGEHHERFPEDYRIGYLRAVTLEESGEEQAAREAFLALLEIDKELPKKQSGAQSNISAVSSSMKEYYGDLPEGATDMFSWFSGRYYAFYYRRAMQSGQVRFQTNPLSGTSGVVRLPGSLAELKSYSVPHIHGLAQFLDGEAMRAELATELVSRGVPDAEILLEIPFTDQYSLDNLVTDELLEKYSGNDTLAAFYILSEVQKLNNRRAVSSPESLLRLADEISEDYPQLSLMGAFAAATIGGDEAFKAVRKYLDAAEDIDNYPSLLFSAVSGLLLNSNLEELPEDLRDRLVKNYEKWIAHRQAELAKKNPNARNQAVFSVTDMVATVHRKTGNLTEYAARLDEKQSEYDKAIQELGSAAASMNGFGPNQRYYNRNRPLLAPLGFPAFETPGIAPSIVADFIEIDGLYRNYTIEPLLPEEAKRLAEEVENPMISAFFRSVADEEEATTAAVESLLASAREKQGRMPLREALLGAGWYQKSGQWEKAMRLLNEIRLLPMGSQLRERIDASLAACAREVASDESADAALVKQGSDAALRLRYGFLSAQERGELVTALHDFGLEKEAGRLEAKGVAARTTSSSSTMMRAVGVQGLPDQLVKLIKDGKRDKAEEMLAKTMEQNVRTMVAAGGGRWDYNILRFVYDIERQQKNFFSDYVEKAKPADDAEADDMLSYAYLLHLGKDMEGAGEYFEKALASLPPNKRSRHLPAAAMILATSDPETAAGLLSEVDKRYFSQLGNMTYGAISPLDYYSVGDSEIDARMNQARTLTRWLVTAAKNPDVARQDLWWVENYVRQPLTYPNGNFSSLHADNLTRALERSNSDAAKMKERSDAHDALCLAMIKIPQLARIGFANYAAGRISESLDDPVVDSELKQLAGVAVENFSERKNVQTVNNHNSVGYIYSRLYPLWYPEEFLMWKAFLAGDDVAATDPILEGVKSARDQNAVRSATAFKGMLFGEGDEFASSFRDFINQPGNLPRSNSYYAGSQVSHEVKSVAEKALAVWERRCAALETEFDIVEFLQEHIRKGKQTLRGEAAVLAADFVAMTAREEGWPAAEELLLTLTGSWLGDRDKWDRFVRDEEKVNQGSRTNGYPDSGLEQCAAFLARVASIPEYAFPMVGFLEEYGLNDGDQITRQTLVGRLSDDVFSKHPELVRRIYESGPFVAEIGEFATGPFGSGNKLAMVQLLDYVAGWKNKEEKESFREFLTSKATFGARLSLAYLDRKESPRATLDLLAENFEAIKAMSDIRQGDLVSLISAVYPKGIPTDNLDENASALAELLGARRAASAKEMAQEILDLDGLKKHGTDRGSELVRELGKSLNPLLQMGEYDLLAEIYWHSMDLVNKEQKSGGWGSYDSAWNAHGDFLYNWLDDVAEPSIERIVLFERIVRQDTEGKIAVCRVGRFAWLLKNEFDRRGGKDEFEGTLTELFTYLWNECGDGVSPETLGYSCDGFVSRLTTPEIIKAIAWADAAAESAEQWSPFARELAMNWRRAVAQKDPANWAAHKDKLPNPNAWRPHFLKLIQDERFHLPWRLALAAPAARVPLENNTPDFILACTGVMADVMLADSPFNGWRFVDVVRSFNRLPVDDRWIETAERLDKGWIVKNRNNDKDHNTGLPWDPWDDPLRVALEMYSKLGDEDKLNRFRREKNAKGRLDNHAKPIFCLVEYGFYDEALDQLQQSLEFADVGTDYTTADNDYRAFYNNAAHENIPPFLETIDEEPLRFFAEFIVRGAVDLPLDRKEKDAAYQPRNARMAGLAERFKDVDFAGREDLRLSLLRQFAYFDNAVWILREPILEAAEGFDLPQLIATQNTSRIRYGMRLPSANALLDFKRGSIVPVRQHLNAVKGFTNNDRYYYEEALEAFSERIAVAVRNRGRTVPAKEIRASADALHLLLATPAKDVIEHDQLRMCVAMKIVADTIADQYPETPSQLQTAEFSEARLNLLGKELVQNPTAFWNLTAAGLKFATPNPDIRPDDETRRQDIERVLKHPLAQQAVEKEKDVWNRMVTSKWVRADEKESEWAKSLLSELVTNR